MLKIISFLSLNFIIGFYLILALQWYSYKFSRILLHFPKPLWHVYFIFIPYVFFIFSLYINNFLPYLIVFVCCLAYGVYLYKNLDKKLVFTARIKRYFLCLFVFSVVFVNFHYLGLEALICAFVCSFLIE
ncbi:UDP-N-acetylmuramoyl-tripeptide--D-alanyl-D-alanine ligase, partial [Campylobacter volucris]|nr:UDP-N-acetylmuramoyl-tripeptide--D-alanyl-D-alanine ligase [Campylobacter volucris]